jgi:hypothetical protein
LEVLGRNPDGTWLEVGVAKGKKGWVSADLAKLSILIETVVIAKAVPTSPVMPSALASTPTPMRGKKDLEVAFINPHYDCVQGEWQYWGAARELVPIWGYRSFQVDMYITNHGDKPVTPPWEPYRWIITDGNQDVESGLVWQWGGWSGLYQQPEIQPGQSNGWTFLAFPIGRNQWVKAVEFVWNGQTYRQDFDLGPYGNAYNYKDCGDPRPHTERPTPTPRP